MYKNIRLGLVFILIALFFAPLGSCAIKKNTVGSATNTTIHPISELSANELNEVKIESFKIYETKIRGIDIQGSGGIMYLFSLIGSLLMSSVKKVSVFGKLVNILLIITFVISYVACSGFAYIAHTTTIYGWTFMLIGFLYVWSCVPCLVPKKLINA